MAARLVYMWRALFRPSYNWQVCSAMRAKFIQDWCLSSLHLQPRPQEQTVERVNSKAFLCHKMPMTELEGALNSSISASAIHLGGK